MKLGSFYKNIIKESPDEVALPDGTTLSYEDDDSIAFGYYMGAFYTGRNHNDMAVDILGDEAGGETDFTGFFDLPGRIFPNHRVISFWDNPEPAELDGVINQLNSDLSMKVDDTWLYDAWAFDDTDDRLISVSDYKRMRDEEIDADMRSLEREWHSMSPAQKEKYRQAGYTKTDFVLQGKRMPMEYRYRLRGEGRVSAGDVMMERYYETIRHPDEQGEVVEIFVNPTYAEMKELTKILTTVRGYLFHTGDLYVWRGDVLHMNVMPFLGDKLGVDLSRYYKDLTNGVAVVKYPNERPFKIYTVGGVLMPKIIDKLRKAFEKGMSKSMALKQHGYSLAAE